MIIGLEIVDKINRYLKSKGFSNCGTRYEGNTIMLFCKIDKNTFLASEVTYKGEVFLPSFYIKFSDNDIDEIKILHLNTTLNVILLPYKTFIDKYLRLFLDFAKEFKKLDNELRNSISKTEKYYDKLLKEIKIDDMSVEEINKLFRNSVYSMLTEILSYFSKVREYSENEMFGLEV